MKKLTLACLTIVYILCLGFALTACTNTEQEASQGLTYELSEDKESYIVTGIGSFEGSNLVIPSKYKGKPVTFIGQAAFYDCKKLTDVTIPDSVTSIGDKAFDGCLIRTIITPSLSIPYIPKDTIETLIITSGERVPDLAFEGCDNLSSVTIGSSVTSIGSYAFGDCNSLASVTIGNGVTSIGEYAFAYCGLTKITIPNSVTSIGKSAFAHCGLTKITIPDSVTSIGSDTFYDCRRLASVRIGNGVTSIGSGTFYDCKSLASVTIGNGVTSIGSSAFGGCEGLTKITIPNSVTSIGEYAFSGCKGLKSVVFKNTSGWYVYEDSSTTSGKNVDVTNASQNAIYLRSTYGDYYWKLK